MVVSSVEDCFKEAHVGRFFNFSPPTIGTSPVTLPGYSSNIIYENALVPLTFDIQWCLDSGGEADDV